MKTECKTRIVPALFYLSVTLLGVACLEVGVGPAPGEHKAAAPAERPENPAVATARLLGEALETAGLFDLYPAPRPATDGEHKAAPPSPFCGAKPEITVADVCGVPVPSAARVAWSDCAPAGSEGETKSPKTAGIVEVSMSVTALSCAAPTDVTVTRHTLFSTSATSAEQGSVNLSGSIAAEGEQALLARSFTRTLAIDVTSTTQHPQGESRVLQLAGTVTVAFAAEPGTRPTQTVSGTVHTSGMAVATIAISELVRERGCRFPIGGELIRTGESGAAQHLVFGPACGDATLDGAKISLLPPRPQGPQGPGGEQDRPPRGDRPPE